MLSVLLPFVVTIPSLLYFSDCCRYDINNFNRNTVFVFLMPQPWCNVYIESAYQTLGIIPIHYVQGLESLQFYWTKFKALKSLNFIK